MHLYIIVYITTGLFIKYAYMQTLSGAERLLENLFNNGTYYKDLRPIKNQDLPITVHLAASLVSLSDFDAVKGKISLVLALVMNWKDEKLPWDPAFYDGVDHLKLRKETIWVPELFLVNPADEIKSIGKI